MTEEDEAFNDIERSLPMVRPVSDPRRDKVPRLPSGSKAMDSGRHTQVVSRGRLVL